jgi:hypothetical protein
MLDPNRTVFIPSSQFHAWYGGGVVKELSKENPNDPRPYIVKLVVPQGASMTHGEKRNMTLKFFNSKLFTRFARAHFEQQQRFVQQVLVCMGREHAANAKVEVPWTKTGKTRVIEVSRFGDELTLQLKP